MWQHIKIITNLEISVYFLHAHSFIVLTMLFLVQLAFPIVAAAFQYWLFAMDLNYSLGVREEHFFSDWFVWEYSQNL